MFILGINLGLKISYTLNFRIRGVKAKEYISVREKKTVKQKIFQMKPVLKREMKKYCNEKDLD